MCELYMRIFGGELVRKINIMTAYVSLISEILYLGIGLVVLKILIGFEANFKNLLELAGGM